MEVVVDNQNRQKLEMYYLSVLHIIKRKLNK